MGALWWTGAQNVVDEALRLAIFLVLARLLTPHVYGLMALVGVYLALANLIVEQGLARALVQREEIRPDHLDTVFWWQLALAALICTFGIFAADVVAQLTDPSLAPVLRAMAFITPLIALNAVQLAQLERELRNKTIAVARLASSIVAGVIAIFLAANDFGIWSLAAQQLVAAALYAMLIWSRSRWRPGRRLSRRALAELSGFAGGLLGLGGLNLLRRQGDKFLIGIALGPAALGLYATAQRLLETLTQACVRPVSQLGLPLLSRFQGCADDLRVAYLRLLQIAAALAFPVFFGLFALAPEIVAAVLGARWQAMATPLRILSALGIFQAIYLVDGALILSQGTSLLRFKLTAVYVFLALALYALLAPLGIEAVCAGGVVAAFVFLPLELHVVRRQTGAAWREFFACLWPATAAATVMAASIFLLKRSAMAAWHDGTVFAVSVPVGAAIYLACLFGLSPIARRLAGEFIAHAIAQRRRVVGATPEA